MARPLTLTPAEARRMKLDAWRAYVGFDGDCDVAWSRYQAELAAIEALEERSHASAHLDSMAPDKLAKLQAEWVA